MAFLVSKLLLWVIRFMGTPYLGLDATAGKGGGDMALTGQDECPQVWLD